MRARPRDGAITVSQGPGPRKPSKPAETALPMPPWASLHPLPSLTAWTIERGPSLDHDAPDATAAAAPQARLPLPAVHAQIIGVRSLHPLGVDEVAQARSEEHTSELQ